MRQVTVLMPTEKPALQILRGPRTRPLVLAPHQIPHTGIIGWAGQPIGPHDRNEKPDTGPFTRPNCTDGRNARPSSGAAMWSAQRTIKCSGPAHVRHLLRPRTLRL
jgi:hypothetical protein